MAQKTDKQRAQELVDDAMTRYVEAMTPQTKKEWAEATLPKVDEAIKLDSKNAEAWFVRGLANDELGNIQDAIDNYTKAIELDPENVLAWNNLGGIKSTLGDYQGAIESFTKVIEIDPESAFARNNRGGAKNESGNFQGAIDDYTKAIELEPKIPILWHNRGEAKDALGDFQGAIDDYTKAIELNPEIAILWDSRGKAKNESGDYQGAIDDFTKAIELNPQSIGLWSKRALAKGALGDHQGAIDDYTKAIELSPKNMTLWSNRGLERTALGDHQSAIDDYTKAIELDPKSAIAWNNRGVGKNEFGEHQGAIDDYTKAIELNPKYSVAWHNRGLVKFRLKKYDDAIKDFDEALKLDPKNTQIQQFRQQAEIVKLRKTTEEYKDEYRQKMTTEMEVLEEELSQHRQARNILLFILFIVIIGYFVWIFVLPCLWGLSCVATDSSNIPAPNPDWLSALLDNLSRFGILSFIVFPIIWGIRLLNAAINRTEILKWDIFSRNNTENSIDYYQSELGDNRNDIIIAYMNNWINNNPADKLITLHSKNPAPTEQSSQETLLRAIKNLLEQLTKRDTKGD